MKLLIHLLPYLAGAGIIVWNELPWIFISPVFGMHLIGVFLLKLRSYYKLERIDFSSAWLETRTFNKHVLKAASKELKSIGFTKIIDDKDNKRLYYSGSADLFRKHATNDFIQMSDSYDPFLIPDLFETEDCENETSDKHLSYLEDEETEDSFRHSNYLTCDYADLQEEETEILLDDADCYYSCDGYNLCDCGECLCCMPCSNFEEDMSNIFPQDEEGYSYPSEVIWLEDSKVGQEYWAPLACFEVSLRGNVLLHKNTLLNVQKTAECSIPIVRGLCCFDTPVGSYPSIKTLSVVDDKNIKDYYLVSHNTELVW